MIDTIIVCICLANIIADIILVKRYKRLRDEAQSIIDKARRLMPESSLLKQFAESEEYIFLSKDKAGDWHANAKCSKEAFKTYCPLVHKYFETTDGAVDEINKIINKKFQ